MEDEAIRKFISGLEEIDKLPPGVDGSVKAVVDLFVGRFTSDDPRGNKVDRELGRALSNIISTTPGLKPEELLVGIVALNYRVLVGLSLYSDLGKEAAEKMSAMFTSALIEAVRFTNGKGNS